MKNYSISKYPDGASTVKVPSTLPRTSQFRIRSYEDLWHLTQYVDVENNHHGRRPEILIPNLFGSQADDRFAPYESFDLKLILKHLNNLNADFLIFHPHNPTAIRFGADNCKVLPNNRLVSMVLERLRLNGTTQDDLVMMSTDSGGFKPMMKLVDDIKFRGEVFNASKSRKWNIDTERSELTQAVDRRDFGGKDILLVDDLCIRGGTFIGLAKILKDRNVGKLFICVSHMTLPQQHEELYEVYDEVFTSNSVYDSYFPIRGKFGFDQAKNLTVFEIFEKD